MASRKWSTVWLYYQDGKDAKRVVCLICLETIQHHGNTSNMRRHLRLKHHAEYANLEAKKKKAEGAERGTLQHVPGKWTVHRLSSGTPSESLNSAVGECGTVHKVLKREEECNSAAGGVLGEAPSSSNAEPKTLSAVWVYYQQGREGSLALCLLCSENVPYWGNESHLLKHLQKRHPNEYGNVEGRETGQGLEEQVAGGTVDGPVGHPSLGEEACGSSEGNADLNIITVGQLEQDQIQRALEQEFRAVQRERELTEQLRRAQEQEARALEQQRVLTEQLRRAQEHEVRALEQQRAMTEQLRMAQEQEMKRARDLEAQTLQRERMAIEQLKRAQEQEAKAVEREREAVEQQRRDLERERETLEQQRKSQEQEMEQARAQESQALQRERELTEQLRKVQEQEARAIQREREALEQLRREFDQRHLRRKEELGVCLSDGKE